MRKNLIWATAIVTIGSISFLGGIALKPNHNLSQLQLSNIEALVGSEGDYVISCSKGHEGQCFRADISRQYICGEHWYYACEFCGIPTLSCYTPCGK